VEALPHPGLEQPSILAAMVAPAIGAVAVAVPQVRILLTVARAVMAVLVPTAVVAAAV